MENVPGILTIGKGRVLKEILSALAELGYKCDARILFAEDFGVPQERRRVFIVGTRDDWTNELFPPGTHGPAAKPSVKANAYVHRWEPGRRRIKNFTTVWDAIGDLPPLQNAGVWNSRTYSRGPKVEYQRELRRHANGVLNNHATRTLSKQMMARLKHIPSGGNWRDIPRRLLPAGMKRARPSDHTKRYGRPRKQSLACTILTKADPHWGAYIHPVDDRAISIREAARLQSFPDRFLFLGKPATQYVQVGNAVPPLMARAIAKAIRRRQRAIAQQAAANAALIPCVVPVPEHGEVRRAQRVAASMALSAVR